MQYAMIRRAVAALVLAGMVAAAPAAASTARCGYSVISTGDTMGEVRQRCGSPDRVVRLENRFGAAVGERWEYDRPNGRQLLVSFTGGEAYAIEEQ